MVGASLAARSRRWSGRARALALVLAIVATTASSAASAALLEEPGRTAPWAPAVGIAGALALMTSGRWRWGFIVLGSLAIMTGNLLVGRPFDFALVTAALRIVELGVLCAVASPGRALMRLDTLKRSLRFVAAVFLSALVFSAGVSAYRAAIGMNGPDAIAIDSFAAHAVALLVVTPLAFAQPDHGGRARSLETAVQWALLALAIGVVFSPANALPLAFLPLPLFAWAALRLSAVTIVSQLVVVSIYTAVVTAFGWGPFGATLGSPRGSIVLLSAYLAVFAGSTIVLWSKRVESEMVADRAVAQDRILRRAVEQAKTAFLLVERLGDSFVVLQANDHGLRALGMDPSNPFFAGSSDINIALPADHPLVPGLLAVSQGASGWRGELVLDAFNGRADADVSMERGAGEAGDIISVELTDITERRREDRRLRALVERERALATQYQELSRQKDDFVASISHELRTPLASIVGYAETLEETELDPMQRRFVDTITRNAGRLQERVEELLSAAKRAADSVDDPHPLAVSPILDDVADDLRPVAAARRVQIVIEESAAALPEVIGTEDAVTRVLTNIVGNAVKFSPDGGTVAVSALADDVAVELFVRDQGPGILPADQERVFDRFYRTEDATANATPGTGLGLSIVRTLLEGIGGSVLVESDGVSGSTFVIRLARARDLEPHA